MTLIYSTAARYRPRDTKENQERAATSSEERQNLGGSAHAVVTNVTSSSNHPQAFIDQRKNVESRKLLKEN